MTASVNIAPAPSGTWAFRTRNAFVSRLVGPGGYYNIGNLIGLATGVGLQLTSLATGGSTATEGIIAYFVGSPASISLTIATIVFLVSGEMYHRAWDGTDAPNADLNRLADVLSAIGAVALTVSLFYLNQPLLALLTSVLIVGGKLGSAVYSDQPGMTEFWPSNWPDLFRSMVLAGRIPGTAAAALELSHQLGVGGPLAATIQPAVMVLCHLFWIRADILLFRDRETS